MLLNPYRFGGGGGGGDPYFSNVQALLHFDGSNGSTTFTNNAGSGIAFASSGSVALSTAQAKFGMASVLVDTSSKSVQSQGINPGLNTNGKDYTVEFWLYQATNATSVFSSQGTSGDNQDWFIGQDGSGHLRFWIGFNGTWALQLTSSSTISLNQWSHIACVKSGSSFYVFVNGVLFASGTYSGSIAAGQTLCIGRNGNAGTFYVDDFRYTVGVARYTAAFTPPSAAFPNS